MRKKMLLFWLCLLVASIPSLCDHLQRMWQFEQYHYLPALLLAVSILIWQRWDWRPALPSGWTWVVLVSGALTMLFALLSGSNWVGSLAFLQFVGAWLMTHREREYDNSLVGLWPPCWLLLTLPLGLDASLTSWLQLWSSRLSSFSLDLLRVPHVLFGNVLELPTGKLFVEEACSGVQSLFTVIFAAVLLVALFRRSTWLLPMYIAAAVFWAGIMNVVRIVAIAFVLDRYAVDIAHGWPHAALGYFCLGLAVLFLLSTDRLLRILAFPIEPNATRQSESNPFVFAWNKIMWLPVKLQRQAMDTATPSAKPTEDRRHYAVIGIAVFALMLATGQTWRLLSVTSNNGTLNSQDLDPFLGASPAMISTLEGFRTIEHEIVEGLIGQPFGKHADVWRGEFKGIATTIALSQPYPSWHDLCVCYTGIGLKMNERKVGDALADRTLTPDNGANSWNFVSARMVGYDGHVTYLWFSAFDRFGNPVFAPDSSVLTRWISRLRDGDSWIGEEPEESEVAIVQLVVESNSFLPTERVADLERFHLDSRDLIRKQTTGDKSDSSAGGEAK